MILSILVNFNSQPMLDPAVESLLSQRLAADHRILVWENGSDREVGGLVTGQDSQRAPGVFMHYSGSGINLGYAPAIQRAWQHSMEQDWAADVTHVHLANPDTAAHGAEVLAELTKAASYHRALVGPAQVDATGQFRLSAYPFMRPYNVPLKHISKGWMRRYARLQADAGRSRDVATLDGSYLVARRAGWDLLGGLDEGYLLYTDDHDLSLRAASRGVGRRLVTSATVTHVGGTSRGRRARLCELEQIRCSLRLVALHYGPAAVRRARWLTASVLLARREPDLAWAARALPTSLPGETELSIEQRYVAFLNDVGNQRARRLADRIASEAGL